MRSWSHYDWGVDGLWKYEMLLFHNILYNISLIHCFKGDRGLCGPKGEKGCTGDPGPLVNYSASCFSVLLNSSSSQSWLLSQLIAVNVNVYQRNIQWLFIRHFPNEISLCSYEFTFSLVMFYLFFLFFLFFFFVLLLLFFLLFHFILRHLLILCFLHSCFMFSSWSSWFFFFNYYCSSSSLFFIFNSVSHSVNTVRCTD